MSIIRHLVQSLVHVRLQSVIRLIRFSPI